MNTPAEEASTKNREIGKQVVKNAGWNYLSFGSSKLLSLVTVAILAHLLSPELFTLVGLANLAIDYLSILNDFGLSAALVHRRENIDEASNVVFTINLLISISLTVLLFFAAPIIASLFNETSLTPILQWLGVSFSLNALGSVHKAHLQRDMQFGKKIIPDLGNTLIKGAISISCALLGYGAWSLVYGQIAGIIISTILLWAVVPWRPHLHFNLELARQLFNYGFSVMTDRGFTIFGDSFDYLLIGLYYYADKSALGIYTLAYRLPDLLIINTLSVLAVVFFPAFSSIQTEKEILQKSFLASLRYVQLLITPLCLGMLIAAKPIIIVIFGIQWLDAIPLMQILSVYALLLSIGFHVGDIYKAIGRPDILLKLAAPIFIIRLASLWIGSQFSLIGIAWGHVVASALELIIRAFVTRHILQVTFADMFKQLTAFPAGAILTLCAIPAVHITQDAHPIVQLLSIAMAGALGYLATVWYLERETIVKLISVITARAKTKTSKTNGFYG